MESTGSAASTREWNYSSYLKYFDAVHRRSLRDIGMLPPAAEGWRPGVGEGENAWDIGQIVAHMAGSRLYFASAYRDEGWLYERWPEDTSKREPWLPCLERSATAFRQRLEGTPNDWLQRRIELIDTPGATLPSRNIAVMCDWHRSSRARNSPGSSSAGVSYIQASWPAC